MIPVLLVQHFAECFQLVLSFMSGYLTAQHYAPELGAALGDECR